MHVLLVDDDEVDVKLVKRAFNKAQVTNPLIVAKDGIEALELLRSNCIPSPRIILMDINMPRMDGITCMRHIRADKSLKQSIIFVMTTSSDDEDKFAAYDLNPAGYIIKSNLCDGIINAIKMIGSFQKVVLFPG